MSESDPLIVPVVPPNRHGKTELASPTSLDFEHHGGIENEVVPNTPQDYSFLINRSWQQYWESWCPLVSILILLAIVAWLIVSNPTPIPAPSLSPTGIVVNRE